MQEIEPSSSAETPHPDFFSKLLKGTPETPLDEVSSLSEDKPRQESASPSQRSGRTLTAILIIALIVSTATAGYFYYQYRSVAVDVAERTELESAVAVVGKHIMLPSDVTPRIGKIANTDEFKDDPFLKQSKIGDLVLFYPYQGSDAGTEARARTVKAILWRPMEGKIVDVSLVTLPEAEGAEGEPVAP